MRVTMMQIKGGRLMIQAVNMIGPGPGWAIQRRSSTAPGAAAPCMFMVAITAALTAATALRGPARILILDHRPGPGVHRDPQGCVS